VQDVAQREQFMTISNMPDWVLTSEDDIGTMDQPPLRKTMSNLGRFIGVYR